MDIRKVYYSSSIDNSMQPALFRAAEGSGARPLVVCLHTWSADLTQNSDNYFTRAAARDWHCIFPYFRGPNWTPEACGSDLVVADLEAAVDYVKSVAEVDPQRIYLVGGSGGGHASLLMAGRKPELWTAVSSWCPISDVAKWHEFSCRDGQIYAEHIRQACDGNPQKDPKAFAQAMYRSPVSYLADVRGKCLIDIGTGIHDGHNGYSVPVSQSIEAFNLLADPADRIAQEDIDFMVEREEIPEHLKYQGEPDPAYGPYIVLLRRVSGLARLTLFEGAHHLLPGPAFGFLERQVRGAAPVWASGESFDSHHAELGK